MSEELQRLLGDARSAGVVDSSGRFTLSLQAAREKLSQFGQVNEDNWTLKFFQCMQMLGCESLQVQVSEGGAVWTLRGAKPGRGLNAEKVRLDINELGLGRQPTAEHCLASALIGLGDIVALEWALGEERHALCGEASPTLRAGPHQLSLRVQFARAYAFPVLLWKEVTAFAPMTLLLGMPRKPVVHGPPMWLESFFLHGGGPRISAWARGSARVNLGEPLKNPRQKGISTIFRYLVSDNDSGSDALVLVHPYFKGDSTFIPLQAGCLLQSMEFLNFPPGLTVIFAADGLPTDLTQFRLRDSQELRERLEQVGRLLPRAVKPLLHQWDKNERLISRPRSSLLLDFPPAIMALVGILPTLVLLASEPLLAMAVAGIFFGLPGAYYKVSRKARRDEFNRLLLHWQSETRMLCERLEAIDLSRALLSPKSFSGEPVGNLEGRDKPGS